MEAMEAKKDLIGRQKVSSAIPTATVIAVAIPIVMLPEVVVMGELNDLDLRVLEVEVVGEVVVKEIISHRHCHHHHHHHRR